MDFIEAEHRFHMLEEQRLRGVITIEQYRTELGRIRVNDTQGRLWMQQEQTGQWFVHQGGQWQPANPPHRAAVPGTAGPPAMAVRAPQAPQPPTQRSTVSFDPLPSHSGTGAQAQPGVGPQNPAPVYVNPQVNAPLPRFNAPLPGQVHAQKQDGVGCLKPLMTIAAGLVLWVIIAVVVYFASDEDPMALLGVGFAALLSVIITVFFMLQHWQGTIVDMRVVREKTSDEDGVSYRNTLYAWVRKPNGKTKKIRATQKWKIGDQLEKRRGDLQIRHYPM